MSLCKNVFITGGNRGIGFELARQILDLFKPQNLIVTCRKPSGAQALNVLGSKYKSLHIVQFDVTRYDTHKDMAAKVDEITGNRGLNSMINNAGVLVDPPTQKSIKTLTRENLAATYEVNVYAPVLLSQAFLPLLEKTSCNADSAPMGIAKASLVIISSRLGSIEKHTSEGPFVSHTALNMLTKCMSLELKEKGILIMAMHPGWVKTDSGGKNAALTVEESVSGMFSLLQNFTESDNGKFYQYDGQEIP